ncbi:MAG: leucine-rich repeat domain-containing protein [Clostridia bacterium]|nr:leucine-rich repeat domain-containing protein [Clostridia bacterium]
MSTQTREGTHSSKGGFRESEGFAFVSGKNGTCTLKSVGKCHDLDIVIPTESPNGDTVTAIGKKAFAGCKKVTSISLPDTITVIGDGAFENCEELVRFILPEGVLSVGKLAFSGCKKLSGISLPSSLSFIGESAFENCKGLKDITLPKGVSTIEKKSFSGCRSLVSVTIPETITAIDEYAFQNCDSLKTIAVPDNVQRIGYCAFWGCSALSNITLPFVGAAKGETKASPKTHLGYIFGKKEYVGSISTATLPQWKIERDAILYYLPQSLKKVTITGGIIFKEAFRNCTNVTDIILGDNVTALEPYAFYQCRNLKTIIFGAGVKTLVHNFYSKCPELKSISLCNGLTKIQQNAFSYTSKITTLTIPQSVTLIEHGSFYGKYMEDNRLTQIVFENPNDWVAINQPPPRWNAQASISIPVDAITVTICASDIQNPTKAAQFLQDTYFSFDWHRK